MAALPPGGLRGIQQLRDTGPVDNVLSRVVNKVAGLEARRAKVASTSDSPVLRDDLGGICGGRILGAHRNRVQDSDVQFHGVVVGGKPG